MKSMVLFGPLLISLAGLVGSALGESPAEKVLRVRPTEDFEVNGRGDRAAWEKTDWVQLKQRTTEGRGYETRVKVLYSKTGLYVLMDASDRLITATINEDFLDLWNEDVFEFFLWPDERSTKSSCSRPPIRKPIDYPGSNFGYASPFSETVLLGNLALRCEGELMFDSKNLKVTNNADANKFINKEYHNDWAAPPA